MVVCRGAGVGEEWAGTVAVEERDEARLVAAVDGQVVRVADARAVRIVGPYYAASAALVPAEGTVVASDETTEEDATDWDTI